MNLLKSLLNAFKKSGSTRSSCRTRMINDRFFECKVKRPNPNYCDHSLCSGEGFICNHEDRHIFARK